MFRNAGDAARNKSFQPVATISKGYDSCASASLASLAGCQESISFFNSKDSDPHSDTGVENARSIGLTCTVYDRWHYLKSDGIRDAEFGLFTNSVSSPFLAAEKQLRHRVLVTGHFGGFIWSKECSAHCIDYSKPWPRYVAGIGNIEFRLRVGFIVFPIAFVAARHNASINRIMNSPEMLPWSIGGEYDRPIQRRIAEHGSHDELIDRDGLYRRLYGTLQQ